MLKLAPKVLKPQASYQSKAVPRCSPVEKDTTAQWEVKRFSSMESETLFLLGFRKTSYWTDDDDKAGMHPVRLIFGNDGKLRVDRGYSHFGNNPSI